jgi:hypothetical protein
MQALRGLLFSGSNFLLWVAPIEWLVLIHKACGDLSCGKLPVTAFFIVIGIVTAIFVHHEHGAIHGLLASSATRGFTQ